MAPRSPENPDFRRGGPQLRKSNDGRYVVFDISGYACGLPLDDVREILPICELIRPPGLPPLLDGFLNLRGELVPGIRIDRLFALAEMRLDLYSHILVARRKPVLALLVERAREIIVAEPAAHLEAPRGGVFGDCLAAVVRLGPDDLNVFELDRLLLRQEESRIAEFQRIEEQRLGEIGGPTP